MQNRNEFKCEAPVAQSVGHGHGEAGRLDALVAAERARLAAGAMAGGGADGRSRLLDLLHRQGAARIDAGQPGQAVECWAEALTLGAGIAPAGQRAALLIDLGRLQMILGRSDAAAERLDAAIALLRALPSAGSELAEALAARAAVYGKAGRAGESSAITLLTEAADLQEARVLRTRQATDAVKLAHTLLDLGRAQDWGGDGAGACATFVRCAEVSEALLAAAPTQEARNIHNATLNHLGRAEAAMGRPEVALGLFRRSAADMHRLVHEDGRQDLADDLARAEADVQALEAALA